eukprot:TRINITY_DN18599_c0_g1_i1.p1 TRINITY_DN18599_c0_g1~~TRINITY_DN18599_c0_g1_i1.p1  ORF type:complete len:101 (+),score=19.71 TRINITY_DN18599_c0_g1_i1:58-360(+)
MLPCVLLWALFHLCVAETWPGVCSVGMNNQLICQLDAACKGKQANQTCTTFTGLRGYCRGTLDNERTCDVCMNKATNDNCDLEATLTLRQLSLDISALSK